MKVPRTGSIPAKQGPRTGWWEQPSPPGIDKHLALRYRSAENVYERKVDVGWEEMIAWLSSRRLGERREMEVEVGESR